jgi:hypothetical protein
MAVNDDAGYLNARGVLASIASRLARGWVASVVGEALCQ